MNVIKSSLTKMIISFTEFFIQNLNKFLSFFQVHQVLTKLTIKKLINLNLTNEMIKNLINLLFSVFALDLSFYNSIETILTNIFIINFNKKSEIGCKLLQQGLNSPLPKLPAI